MGLLKDARCSKELHGNHLREFIDNPRTSKIHTTIHIDTQPVSINQRLADLFRRLFRHEANGSMSMNDLPPCEALQHLHSCVLAVWAALVKFPPGKLIELPIPLGRIITVYESCDGLIGLFEWNSILHVEG